MCVPESGPGDECYSLRTNDFTLCKFRGNKCYAIVTDHRERRPKRDRKSRSRKVDSGSREFHEKEREYAAEAVLKEAAEVTLRSQQQ